jgi:hypothetical protein
MFLLSSCDNFGYYKLDHPEFFTEATSSLLGVRGRELDGTDIIETDKYGRGMFSYCGSCSDDNQYIFALMIYQKIDDNYIYYYSNGNFIYCPYKSEINEDSVEKISTDNNKTVEKYFSKEKIEQLKSCNDWNKELDENKFFKVKIYREKGNSISLSRVKNAFSTKSEASEFESRNSYYLTSDKDGKSIYFVRGMDNRHNYTKSYIIFFDGKGNFDKEKGIEEVPDIWNYTEQLSKFKEKNRWKKY